MQTIADILNSSKLLLTCGINQRKYKNELRLISGVQVDGDAVALLLIEVWLTQVQP